MKSFVFDLGAPTFGGLSAVDVALRQIRMMELGELKGVAVPARHTELMVVRLAPGEYESAGIAHPDIIARGRRNLVPHMRIMGAGMYSTTVKLMTHEPGDSGSGFNCAFSTWFDEDIDDIEISDLTIDCNYAGLRTDARHNLSLRGVMAFGSNIRLRNVRVINSAGLRWMGYPPNKEETFVLHLGAQNRDAYGLEISGCVVEDVAPGSYVSAISLLAAPGWWVVNGVVRDCIVRGSNHLAEQAVTDLFGLNLQRTHGAQYLRNRVWASRCFSNDTFENLNLLVAHNYFEPTVIAGMIYASKQAVFDSNTVHLTRSTSLEGFRVGQDAVNPLFRNTLFTGPGAKKKRTPPCIYSDKKGVRFTEVGTIYHPG